MDKHTEIIRQAVIFCKNIHNALLIYIMMFLKSLSKLFIASFSN